MPGSTAIARKAVLAAGMLTVLVAAQTAQAQQRRGPRIGVAAQPRPEPTADPRRDPAWYGVGDPRRHEDPRRDDRGWNQRSHGPTVIYVPVPTDFSYGYGYGAAGYYGGGAYYPTRVFGGVTDANGRPLTTGYENAPTAGGYGYTPDLSGAPYSVSDEGMMVVDFPTGERRAFPSCAESADARDPQGRPRTIFYRSPDYWMVLRPGQRGRVLGDPPAQAKACYAIDSTGRMVLRY